MAALEFGNPFVLMMNPEAVLQAVERSERLSRIKGRVCRPLDRPLIPRVRDAHLSSYDAEIDAEVEGDLDFSSDGAS